jgi:hypothetical protein
VLRTELGHAHVQRLAPDPRSPYLMPPQREAGLLPSYAQLSEAFAAGAHVVASAEDGVITLSFATGQRGSDRASLDVATPPMP